MDPEAAERDDPRWAAALARRHDPTQGPGAWKPLLAAIRDEIIAAEPLSPEQLRRARVPVLLAYGDRDPWVPLEQAVWLRRHLPDARLLVAPGSGHVVDRGAAQALQRCGAFVPAPVLGRRCLRSVSDLPATDPTSGERLDHVALVTIDRPAVLNALDSTTMAELVATLQRLDAEASCRCIVLTGAGERAFAAGADIREMAALSPEQVRCAGLFERWDEVAAIGTPLIAAVRGYALGGGFELALACDLIIAADDAAFGLPEVSLGIMPGVGGTQRLPRAVGQALAMEMILAGRRLSGVEAAAVGLAARAVPAAEVVSEALRIAVAIAANAPHAVREAKRAVRAAAEAPLAEGVASERRAFAALFGTDDQREGMAAFLEKRRPTWTGR